MPNLVNRLAVGEFTREARDMGSCVVVRFDRMTVAQASELRRRLRDADVRLRVVKNRLAVRAFAASGHELPRLSGKCGLVFAPEEKAITAAKLVRDFQRENRAMSLEILAGIIEGEVITGEDATRIADMLDKDGIRARIASVIREPARSLAACLQGLNAGLARCLEQRADGEGEG